MNGRVTDFEHVAKTPELALVEYTPAPDAEACALRVVLVRVTDERNYWRNRAQRLEHAITRAAEITTGATIR